MGVLKIIFYLILIYSFIEPLASNDLPKLLLGNRANIQLLDAANPTDVELIVDDIDYTMSCDYIYSDNLIFWIDSAAGQDKIQSTFTNVSFENRIKRNVITTGLVRPDGLACDWISKKLYWTDDETDRIEVNDINGKIRKVLVWDQLDQPRAIAVDPIKGYMYWTDWGENPKIERAGMDGSNRISLVERDGIYWPNGLTLDYDEDKIYWVDANYHYINRMNTDGTGREVVVSNGPTNSGSNSGNYDSDVDILVGSLQHPFAITLSGDRIYWTDWSTPLSIHSAVKNGSGQTTVLQDNISPLNDIHSYGPHRQKQGRNPCGKNNGGCSHLCLISPKHPYYTCACPTGVKLQSDGKTCNDGPESILLLARRPDLRVISLDTPDYTDIVVPLQNIKYAIAVDYDPVDGFVYWSNILKKAIYRARLNGSDEEKIISDEIEQCDGIAVDWVARNFYWAEAGRNYIAVSRLNGTSRRVLIEEGIANPRAIALDIGKGQMYWSDWGDPKIERASMDGTDRYVFVNTSIQWPNGLAIDHKRGLLYWAEAYLDKIEVIGLNGSGRRVLLEEKIPHIFGFSLLDDYLYWSDWEKRKVERMLVNDKRSRHSMIEELPDLMGIKATHIHPSKLTNPCANNNGGCSHLCLYTPKGPRCQCPNGQELLSDMRNCIEPEAFLFFTLASAGVRRISLETALKGSIQVPFPQHVDAIHLDVSVDDNTIYWTDNDKKQIFRASMNGTNVQSVVDQGASTLEGIAVDWLGRNIYWADSLTSRIEVARMDTTSRRPIVLNDLDFPSSVAVDPVNGFIYWSEWGRQPKIRRAHMDGSHVTTLLGNGEIGRANSLTIDYENKRLYWVDIDANVIYSSNMTGQDRLSIFSSVDKAIFIMTLYNDYIYWTKGNSIERANKTNGANRQLIQEVTHGEEIHDMLVYHTSRQTGVSACSHANGGCEHICLSVPGGTHQCTCTAHYKLKKDNVSCSAPETFLLFSQDRYISRVVPSRQNPDPAAVLPIRNLGHVISIDYDPIEGYVYWIDQTLGEIKKSRMNGSEVTTVLSNNKSNHHPYDLAIDPFGKYLFWTDSYNNTINIMQLDGTIIGTIVENMVRINEKRKFIRPRKIVVHPTNGKIFFSSECPSDDDSCRTSIICADYAGREVISIIDRGIDRVTGLAIDHDAERLYWSNVGLQKIEVSDLNGNHKKSYRDDVSKPGAITILGSNVYWVDETVGATAGYQIVTDKKSGHSKVLLGMMEELNDIVGVTSISRRDFAQHPCTKNNGGCSHICIGKDDGTNKCSCPKHLSLIDDFSCGESSTCKASDFICSSQGSDKPCIPANWRCDGEEDCYDASDEQNCPPCDSPDKFQCGTGMSAEDASQILNIVPWTDIGAKQCIPVGEQCNGKADCIDGSDERNCPCAENQFTCNNRHCISNKLKCDGVDNCGDASDEDCPNTTLSPGSLHDSTTWIIAVISVVCITAIITVIVISFRKRKVKSRNDMHGNDMHVMYTARSLGGIQVNVEFNHGDHIAQVDHSGNTSHSAKAQKKGSGHSTASVNFSIGPRNPEGAAPIVDARLPQPHHPILPGPQLGPYGTMRYASTYNISDHMMLPQFQKRPHITGASSSSSSSRTNKQYLPTLNPPPSPATDRSGSKSAGECQYSSDSPSTRTAASYYRCRNGHRHSRRMYHHHAYMPAPHPTPCPSDSYDDCSYHSGSGREFDTLSRRSKSGGAPTSPPPPYCHFYHHMCVPYMGYNGGYHPYMPPSSYHSSHHGYRTPPLGHEPHHHSSSSSGSTRLNPQECMGPCCRRQTGRHYHSSSRKGSRGMSSHRQPPRYNAVPFELNSDSDPFAPPPTPRSHYMSDYCCTHDEAEDNQDDDPTRFVNQLEEEVEDDDSKDTDPLINKDPTSENNDDASVHQQLLKTKCEPADEGEVFPSPQDDNSSPNVEEKADEPLIQSDPSRSSSSNTELDYPIFDPPPSPVTDSS
ncbi:low-density lipoprotein receptor-related protein 6-like isoform X1 [Styela clava]